MQGTIVDRRFRQAFLVSPTRWHVGRMVVVAAVSVLLSSVACSSRRTPEYPVSRLAVEVDSLVPALLKEHQVPGAAVALLERGRVVLARGYGLRDVARGLPLTDTTPINVASLSKSVTTWGILRLVQQGRLSLDDPVNDHLRSWRLESAGFSAEDATVRRLLEHTAGTNLPAVPWFPTDSAAPSLVKVLRGEAGGGPPVQVVQPPGAEWSYSGGGYTVLELLTEDVTGILFEQFMHDSVFSALGMFRSTFSAPPPDAAIGYDENNQPYPPYRFVGSSAGGFLSTADDFGRLLHAYATAWKTGNAVLDSATIRRVADDPVTVKLDGVQGARYGLGHGIHLTADSHVLLYHSGGNPGFVAYFIVDPVAGNGLFVAANSDNGIPVLSKVREHWGAGYGEDLPPLF